MTEAALGTWGAASLSPSQSSPTCDERHSGRSGTSRSAAARASIAPAATVLGSIRNWRCAQDTTEAGINRRAKRQVYRARRVPWGRQKMFRISSGAILWLLALIAWPALAASPYPQSTLITGITWDVGSYRWTAQDADIWPITWASDDALVAAWGDGQVSCAQKASYGVAAITADQPSATLSVRHCGPGPDSKGKKMAIVAAGSQLYTRFNPQDGSSGFPVWRSGDGGRTWTKPTAPLSFLINSFVQFGRANSGAPGGYVYALENRTTGIFLVRAPAASVQTNSAYQYFSGTVTAPAWSSKRADAKSIFTDPAGIQRPSITYVPGLDRYLLAVAHSLDVLRSGDRLGIFEAPEPYGPWRTVSYVEDFLGMTGGIFLGMNFPIKWQADGGRTLWATFSCYQRTTPSPCGQYHDRFNLMKATLRVGRHDDGAGVSGVLQGHRAH